MTVRVYLTGDRVGPKLDRLGTKSKQKILRAERGAAEDVRKEVLKAGRADIKQAGHFGTRWTEGFQGKITEGGGNIRIAFTHAVPYWRVFQYGAIIRGKPLLWIPLSFAKDAQGIRARDFPGKLFRVDRKGGKAPLLLSSADGQPKYFGKESVRIPKKFHIVEIVRDGARHLKEFYKNRFKSDGK